MHWYAVVRGIGEQRRVGNDPQTLIQLNSMRTTVVDGQRKEIADHGDTELPHLVVFSEGGLQEGVHCVPLSPLLEAGFVERSNLQHNSHKKAPVA